jgi:hypothetical protein
VLNAPLAALVLCAGSVLVACGGGSSLTGTTWYLTSGTQQTPAWQWVVPPGDQSRYTITFNADGTRPAIRRPRAGH